MLIQADTDVGTIETLARSVADDLELLSHSSGLPNVKCQVGLAAEPGSEQIAADQITGYTTAQFASIEITVSFGLTA